VVIYRDSRWLVLSFLGALGRNPEGVPIRRGNSRARGQIHSAGEGPQREASAYLPPPPPLEPSEGITWLHH